MPEEPQDGSDVLDVMEGGYRTGVLHAAIRAEEKGYRRAAREIARHFGLTWEMVRQLAKRKRAKRERRERRCTDSDQEGADDGS